MATERTPSGLSTLERYRFESQILTDPVLGKWFVALCNGDELPSVAAPEETLALMEQRGLIQRSGFGWRLRPEGREFARTLGLLPAATPAESNPEFVAKSSRRPSHVRSIWAQFKKQKTEQLRNVLMENYLHLVRHYAERIHVKLPDEVELDDLMSAGIFGLMDAINAFDLERGISFETYCAPRIRGAILDELRSMEWVPRLVRSRVHKLDIVSKQLQAELGRSPTNDEIAKRLKVHIDEVNKRAKDPGPVETASLSRKWFETDNQDVREIEAEEETRGADPLREIQRKDLKELITKGLRRVERLVIILYYFEEKSMKEIAAELDLSESRVSQMHSSVLARLKAQMAERRREYMGTKSPASA